jgi:hypothetical protein
MNAIVTLAIGRKYERMFDKYCRKNWQEYCDKFGYDLIVITEPLDKSERASRRSPSWQKLLILSQDWSSKYERIVWVDSDIIINSSNAYDISDGVPIEKVGAVETYSLMSEEIYKIAINRGAEYCKKNNTPFIEALTPNAYYSQRGINDESLNKVVQCGVFVCSPLYHKDIFEHIYNTYEDTHGAEWNYEMPYMSYELIKADKVHWISHRFNFSVGEIMLAFYPEIWVRKRKGFINLYLDIITRYIGPRRKQLKRSLNNVYSLSIFMHFAACSKYMGFIKSRS